MKKVFYLLLALCGFFTSCSNDSDFDRISEEMKSISDDEFFAQLEVLDLMSYDSNETILVPNGQCLIGAIISAGQQLGVSWDYLKVELLTRLYLGSPSVDIDGNFIGYNTNPLTLKKFLGTFFQRVSFLPLETKGLDERLGKGATAIGLLEDKESNTSHAYNIQSKCTKHKSDCFICYDSVTGETVHLKASQFETLKCFFLMEPKHFPSSDNQE